MRTCSRCGTPLDANQRVCHACGHVGAPATSVREPVSIGGRTRSEPPRPAQRPVHMGPPVHGRLVMQWGSWNQEIELHGQPVQIGRAPDNDLVVPAPFIAPHHAVVEVEGDCYRVRDISGWHGLLSHGRFVPFAWLQTGFSVRVGDGESNLIQLTYFDVEPAGSTPAPTPVPVPQGGFFQLLPEGAVEATIGRDPSSTFILDHPMVGRRHAVLKHIRGQWIVQDLRSRDGTYLNGRRISHAELHPGDILQIGPFSALYTGAAFEPAHAQATDALRIDVIDAWYQAQAPANPLGNGQSVGPTLLTNINLTILPGEFMSIVGGSGAGKSTLMRLLAGLYTPSHGVVLYNGLNLAAYRSAFARSVGYVPQDDIVHADLTVEDALMYAARLRLPADLTREQLQARVSEALEAVDLGAQRGQVIKTLSGGQRKRVSIAVELLPQPRLLFLDEPTSGLDPGLDKRMMFLLRRLADRGHTVILVTHTPAHLDLCDNVVFMGVGGHATFFGAPHLITSFFGQADLADVFSSIDGREAAQKMQQRFEDSTLFQENVLNRQRGIPAPTHGQVATPLSPSARNAEIFRQSRILIRRQLSILLNDRVNLTILLLQAPIIALLIALVAGSEPFHLFQAGETRGCPVSHIVPCGVNSQRLVFIMACAVVWFGMLNSVRELVKERPITVRERMVGVLPPAYLASKFISLALLGLIQAPVLLLVIVIIRGMPDSGTSLFPSLLDMGVTLVLALFAGLAMGLVISALSPTSDRAMSYAPFLLLPQILFSGVLFSLVGVMQVLSFLCPSRWATGALGDTAGLAQDTTLGALYTSNGFAHLGQWLALLCLIAAGLAATYVLQQRHSQV